MAVPPWQFEASLAGTKVDGSVQAILSARATSVSAAVVRSELTFSQG